jgi:hypothetical protein
LQKLKYLQSEWRPQIEWLLLFWMLTWSLGLVRFGYDWCRDISTMLMAKGYWIWLSPVLSLLRTSLGHPEKRGCPYRKFLYGLFIQESKAPTVAGCVCSRAVPTVGCFANGVSPWPDSPHTDTTVEVKTALLMLSVPKNFVHLKHRFGFGL